MSLADLFSRLKGGVGSGNKGHAGIPGHRGGSAPKGGSTLLSIEGLSNKHQDNIKKFLKVLPKQHLDLVKEIKAVDSIPFHPEASGSYLNGIIEIGSKSKDPTQTFLHEMGELVNQKLWPHPKNMSQEQLQKMMPEISKLRNMDSNWLGLTKYERDYGLNETHSGMYRVWATSLAGDTYSQTVKNYWKDQLPIMSSIMDDVFSGKLKIKDDSN